MGDIQRMNRLNTSFGGTSINRGASQSAQVSRPQTQGNNGGFFNAAQRFLKGFGKK